MDTTNRELLSELCNLEIPGDIHISPKGDKVLYSTCLTWGHYKGKYPVSSIWLANIGEANSSKKITDGTSKDHSLAWNPVKNDEFAFVSDRAGNATKSAIYTVSVDDTTNPVAITPVENESAIEKLKFSPDGKLIAFLSKDEKTEEEKRREADKEDVQVWGQGERFSRLRIVELATKQVRTLPLDKHIMDFCWIPAASGRSEELSIVFDTVDSTFIEHPHLHGTDLYVVSTDLKRTQKICSLSNRAGDLTWGSTNQGRSNELYFWCNAMMNRNFSSEGLWKLDVNGQASECERVQLEDDMYVTSVKAVGGHIIVGAQHRLQDCIVAVGNKELYSCGQEIEAYDVASGFLDKQSHPSLVVATSDINNPVEVFSVDGVDGKRIQLSQHGASLQGRQFGICKTLTCPTTNDPNCEIDGIFLEPIGNDHDSNDANANKARPMIVLVHGGPTTRVTNAFNTLYYMQTPYFLSKGYSILLPNYRGSSGRGESFASAVYGKVGTVEVEDVLALTNYAVKQGLADPERLVIGGYSHGGLVCNLCALRNGAHGFGWKFKAAVSGASMCDLDQMSIASDMGSTYMTELHGGAAPWTRDVGDTTVRGGSALWAFKQATERSRREGSSVIPPILLIHGAADERIHVSQAWGMRRALEYHRLPFEMVVYPRQGHMFQEQFVWIDSVERAGQWIEKYIGPGWGSGVKK